MQCKFFKIVISSVIVVCKTKCELVVNNNFKITSEYRHLF